MITAVITQVIMPVMGPFVVCLKFTHKEQVLRSLWFEAALHRGCCTNLVAHVMKPAIVRIEGFVSEILVLLCMKDDYFQIKCAHFMI